MQLTRKRLAGPSLRGLLSTRKGTLALALLCGLAATVILVFALGRYRQSVNTPTKQDTVLVATSLIQKGAAGDVIASQQLFKATPVLAGQMSAGALSDSSLVHGKVTVSDILPGQQLTAADFASQAGIATSLAPGQRAVAVTLDAAHGLTNIVQAGDHVDVYGAFTLRGAPMVGLVVPDARVLQVPGTGSGSAASSVVLAVSTHDSPQVAFTSENGKIWLVLRPGNATSPPRDLATLDSILFSTQATLSPSNPAVGATGAHP